jgi:hypothetical protein
MLAGDLIVRAFRVSTFEGAAGYLVVFVLVPLGFVVGFATGLVVMRTRPRPGLRSALSRLGLALAITAGLLGAGYGVAYSTRDRPPRIEGRPLSLQLELRHRMLSAMDRPEAVRASLFATRSDNAFIDLVTDDREDQDGWAVLSGVAALRSKSAGRMLSVTHGDGGYEVFELPLAPAPGLEDTAWVGWFVPRAPLGAAERPVASQAFQLRYRVRVDE